MTLHSTRLHMFRKLGMHKGNRVCCSSPEGFKAWALRTGGMTRSTGVHIGFHEGATFGNFEWMASGILDKELFGISRHNIRVRWRLLGFKESIWKVAREYLSFGFQLFMFRLPHPISKLWFWLDWIIIRVSNWNSSGVISVNYSTT
jgi:hypothetical protein